MRTMAGLGYSRFKHQSAAAMIDRLAHHGYILLFEGESYRMKNALMRQKK